jgi:hypothetical protein
MIYNLPATPASLQFDEVFFQPAMTVLHDYCRREQTNGVLPDARFLRLGLERCLGPLIVDVISYNMRPIKAGI